MKKNLLTEAQIRRMAAIAGIPALNRISEKLDIQAEGEYKEEEETSDFKILTWEMFKKLKDGISTFRASNKISWNARKFAKFLSKFQILNEVSHAWRPEESTPKSFGI